MFLLLAPVWSSRKRIKTIGKKSLEYLGSILFWFVKNGNTTELSQLEGKLGALLFIYLFLGGEGFLTSWV